MKHETRKEEITRIAAILFKEKGYSAVTMRDIAKSIGIKAASLYNHINSKQEILKIIIISIAEEFTKGMEIVKSSNTSSLDKLSLIIASHIKIANQNTFGMASLNNDWMHLEDQLKHYLKLRTEYEDNFRNIIIAGIENRELINEDPDVMLFSMLSTLRSLHIWIPKKEDLNQDQLAKSLSKILIQGISR